MISWRFKTFAHQYWRLCFCLSGSLWALLRERWRLSKGPTLFLLCLKPILGFAMFLFEWSSFVSAGKESQEGETKQETARRRGTQTPTPSPSRRGELVEHTMIENIFVQSFSPVLVFDFFMERLRGYVKSNMPWQFFDNHAMCTVCGVLPRATFARFEGLAWTLLVTAVVQGMRQKKTSGDEK